MNIEDVPLVNEFMDVYLSEISCLSPAKAVEFTINLVLETAPIYKAPY